MKEKILGQLLELEELIEKETHKTKIKVLKTKYTKLNNLLKNM